MTDEHKPSPDAEPPEDVCRWCGKPLDAGKRWCNDQCKFDWLWAEDRK